MESTWTISTVGIIMALGGLGFIAIFFALIGGFFKRSAQRKQKKEALEVSPFKSNGVVKESEEKENANSVKISTLDDEEIVAVIGAALTAYMPTNGHIVSVKRVGRKSNDLWRLHSAQNVWRIKRK